MFTKQIVYHSKSQFYSRLKQVRGTYSTHVILISSQALKLALKSTNSDAPGLSDPAHIESIQEKAQCAMEEYVR